MIKEIVFFVLLCCLISPISSKVFEFNSNVLVRNVRSPTFGLFGGGLYGHRGSGGGSQAQAQAQSGGFGAQSQAQSQSLSFGFGPFSASLSQSQSQAQSGRRGGSFF